MAAGSCGSSGESGVTPTQVGTEVFLRVPRPGAHASGRAVAIGNWERGTDLNQRNSAGSGVHRSRRG